MNLKAARFNMVHQQVRPWDVSSPKILDLLSTIPRERFVPATFQELAFSDTAIPIGFDQVMLAPKIVGRLLQALDLNPKASVLEIGTGTGYVTTLLGNLVKKLVSIEIIPELSVEASANLSALDIHNVHLEIGDGVKGWPIAEPYDAIIYTGSLAYLPKELHSQLSPNGKLIAILGLEPVMSATLFTAIAEDKWTKQILFETVIPPLLNAPESEGFKF
jgi:protein-L-isoaspartate(D-aspartate) O-methyltransferase